MTKNKITLQVTFCDILHLFRNKLHSFNKYIWKHFQYLDIFIFLGNKY